MKTHKKSIFSFILLSFILLVTSCSSDKDEVVLNLNKLDLEKYEVNFNFDPEAEDIESQSVKILAGNGDYSVFIVDKNVADCEYNVEENNIIISGKAIGKTKVIVTDKLVEVATIDVYVRVEKIIIDNIKDAKISLEIPQGVELNKTYNISFGNGGYAAESSDEEIIQASITNNTLKLYSPSVTKGGEATVIVTDNLGVTYELEISLTTTVIPYPDNVLKGFEQISRETFMFNDYQAGYGTSFKTKQSEELDNTLSVSYSDWWGEGDSSLNIYFKGERKAGIIEGGQIDVTNIGGITVEEKVDLAYLNIFKINEDLMYVAFSYIDEEDVLRLGYMVIKAKA